MWWELACVIASLVGLFLFKSRAVHLSDFPAPADKWPIIGHLPVFLRAVARLHDFVLDHYQKYDCAWTMTIFGNPPW